MSILKEDLDTKYGQLPISETEIPAFITENLNPKFALRQYQREVFQYFLTNMEKPFENQHNLLFHLATGSGKTLIMAGLILYFYKRGYRDFLFFVNALNIIEKTKENFANPSSPKYLFNEKIAFDGREVKIRQVENFDQSDADSINICFTTIQGLHAELYNISENSLSFKDFEDKKVIMLADEAHHINVETKQKLSSGEKENADNWERTVKRIFGASADNYLFEFTATMDLENPDIKEKYEKKIIFEYTLEKFCADKFSKDVRLLRADLEPLERALQAVILSQYRRKIAEKNNIFLKPVVLMKSETNKETESNYEKFIENIENLKEKDLLRIKKLSGNFAEDESGGSYNIMQMVFKYFEDNKITLQNLIKEIQGDFSREKCMLIHSKQDSEEKQILVNNLEEHSNEIRAIFNTDKLTEGWDVLNLFDIVRLYETRDSGHSKIGAKTISEAQLIGRGARYYPFAWGNLQKDMRKFDGDLDNEMRVLEELHYHSPNNHRYISELKQALIESGIWNEKTSVMEIKLKESFIDSDFYKNGFIFLNERQKKYEKKDLIEKLKNLKTSFEYSFRNRRVDENSVFTEKIRIDERQNIKTERIKLDAFSDSLFRTAFSMDDFYSFAKLRNYLPIETMDDFKTELKQYEVTVINKPAGFNPKNKMEVLLYILQGIKDILSKESLLYEGLKTFTPLPIKKAISIKKTLKFIKEQGAGAMSSAQQFNFLSLDKEDWYAYNECFGTSEEKSFVQYFYSVKEELKKIYEMIYLVRNERDFKIFNFDDGAAFEPDFVLFLQKKNGKEKELYQLFIEPKGDHLFQKDIWKQNFLLKIKERAKIELLLQSKKFNLYGLPFYNSLPQTQKTFIEKFKDIVKL
ncbi:MAG: DEAD/DEAH box helicase family protein [Elusimicrobiota bacterium]|jgi:type III restriction enzyme|nr:DEAD/DEAH box helicase family protein [Elusimicrobiota bacterium]